MTQHLNLFLVLSSAIRRSTGTGRTLENGTGAYQGLPKGWCNIFMLLELHAQYNT